MASSDNTRWTSDILKGVDNPAPIAKPTGLTRKFSRKAEILLIRGMLKHGKTKSWKKIYDEQPGLHHIKRCALKDRARSRRFHRILANVELDPSLLDRPDELCGTPCAPVYAEEEERNVIATPIATFDSNHVRSETRKFTKIIARMTLVETPRQRIPLELTERPSPVLFASALSATSPMPFSPHISNTGLTPLPFKTRLDFASELAGPIPYDV